MRIALCQLNSIMGDIEKNTAKIRNAVSLGADKNVDLFVFPEMFVSGYPPRDLLTQRWFLDRGMKALDELCEFSKKYARTAILTGCALSQHVKKGKGVYNAAVVIFDGAVKFSQYKSLLPTYDVFDETRYFESAPNISLFEFKSEKLGISICEDAWSRSDMWNRPLYSFDPVEHLVELGATININISASPYNLGKQKLRYSLVERHAKRYKRPFVFVNLTGGNDELIFDGNSMYFDGGGTLRDILPSFTEDIRVIDTKESSGGASVPEFDTIQSVHDALVLGIRDYMSKCSLKSSVVGLSGGIDSAVACCLAVRALGAGNVIGVAMPSCYSSEGSVRDAKKLARNLGIELKLISIENVYESFLKALSPHFEGRGQGITEENIQARVRGSILMALSNKYGSLVFSTGNKSELAVGYCTLYGDMNGGLSVISDLAKTKVYELARYINRKKAVIPSDTLTKPPSAELREGQKDQDSLPPYDILDGILELIVEEGLSCEEAVEKGYDRHTVEWVSRAVARNEYKRRQAPPGLRVTTKAFGMGRRFPIAARYERSRENMRR